MLLALICLIACVLATHAASPSLVITMMCRDEEVNIKANLAKWLPFVDYFVFMIDSRTKDNTETAIKAILTQGKKDYKIVKYTFDGFGSARTLSLTEAWNTFPQATHILIADPDWAPRIDTIKIQDLVEDAEVYRFVVFDRNGVTRRKMDWLLKHREGLAMKYHLHEVLDIGNYQVIHTIDWVLDEIEKPGSWHTTVGHGNSTSLKRYNFDLEMLNKDLEQYGHDPHVHYYLGITNNAVVTKMAELGQDYHTVLADSIKYLHLRVESSYDEEFVDERWASMYMLGITYVNYKKDYTKATYWFSMCRDFNPTQFECGLALAKLHLMYGMFDSAMVEVDLMLKQETVERDYLTHFKQNACELPEVVITVLSTKASNNLLSLNEAKYLVLMYRMRQNPICGEVPPIDETLKRTINKLLKESSLVNSITIDSSLDKLCSDGGLQNYLISNKIVVHPCESFRDSLALAQHCSIFSYNMPPANEEMQSNTDAKEFVGAALMMDIIHHVFGGNSAKVFESGHTYRFLFASYFNPKIVFNLIGFFDRTGFTNYEIVIVADDSTIHSIKVTLENCRGSLSNGQPAVIYSKIPIDEYLKHALTRKRYQSSHTLHSVLFDYVEYNYGLSVSAESETELNSIRELLNEDGVIGLTYFTKNHHVDKINRLLEKKDATAFVPFSFESSRLIKNYLELNSMQFLTKDYALITFLGGEPSPVRITGKDSKPPNRVSWRGFTQNEVTSELKKAGLSISAWMPSSYAHPYDEIDFFQIKKYKALGIDHNQFIEEFLTFFRYTVYVQNESNPNKPRRAKLTVDVFNNDTLAKKILVIDRLGSLSNSFAGAMDRAVQGLQTSFAFAPYSMVNKVSLSTIVLPSVTACLSQLSSALSVDQLHKINMEFTKKNNLNVSEDENKERLVTLLSYLEMINAITFVCEGCSVNIESVPPEPSIEAKTVKPGLILSTNGEEVLKSKARTEVDESVVVPSTIETEPKNDIIKIGGLSFSKKSEVDSSSSSSVKNTEASNVRPTKQDTDTRVQRMKALGFSDAQIAELLKKSEKSSTSSSATAVKPSVADTTNVKSEAVKPDQNQQVEVSKDSAIPKKKSGLDDETRIKRMKALGFSDAQVAEMLKKSESSIKNTMATPTVEVSAGNSKSSTSDESPELLKVSAIPIVAEAKETVHTPVKSVLSLDDETRIKRLKALGFSDVKIAEIMAKKTSSSSPAAASSASVAGTVESNEKKPVQDSSKVVDDQYEAQVKRLKTLGYTDAKIADLLSRQGEKARSVTAATTSSGVKSEPEPVQSTSVQSTVSGESVVEVKDSSIVKEETQLKGKLKEILNLLNEKDKKIASGAKSDSAAVASKTSSGSSATLSSQGISGKNGIINALTYGEIVDNVALITLPNIQSRAQLVASYRRIECYHWLLESKSLPNDCNLLGPVKRKTSVLGTVSAAKLEFDVSQLKYLQRLNLLSTKLPLDVLLSKYDDMLTYVNNRKVTERQKLARLSLSTLPATTTGILNRVVQLSTNDADVTNLVHLGAVRYILSIAEELSADFTVVDILLKDEAMVHMSRALLSSTVWFDSSNGLGMVSHFDDGLVLESVKALAQYIAFSVSTTAKPLKVTKYYTVAMSLDKPGTSAVAMANGEEIAAILWLNPFATAVEAKTKDEAPAEDGLRIYDDVAAGRLFAQGISVYPSAHSDFFSKSGDLLIDMAVRCNMTNSELVQRKTNRLVLLQPRRPFFFTVPPVTNPEAAIKSSVDEFEARTMIALVVYLSKG